MIKKIRFILTAGMFLSAVIFMYIKTFTPPKQRLLRSQNIEKSSKPNIILKHTQLDAFGIHNIHGCKVITDKSDFFQKEQRIVCTNAHCSITTKHNNIAKLNSPIAHIDQKEKTLFLPKNVRGFFKDIQLQSNDALYDSKKELITAHNIVLTADQPNVIIKSQDCNLDLNNEVIELKDGVWSQIRFK